MKRLTSRRYTTGLQKEVHQNSLRPGSLEGGKGKKNRREKCEWAIIIHYLHVLSWSSLGVSWCLRESAFTLDTHLSHKVCYHLSPVSCCISSLMIRDFFLLLILWSATIIFHFMLLCSVDGVVWIKVGKKDLFVPVITEHNLLVSSQFHQYLRAH